MTRSLKTKISPTRRRLIKAALAGIVAPTVLRMGAAFAAYPDRPVKIVVANTPGGPSDIIARIMAAAMQEVMGGSVIVENKGGGGGNIGMGYRRARRCRRLHHPALDQRLFGQSRPLQHPAIRPVQGFRRRLRACGARPTCSR